MPDTELELASVLSRISQLEERQNVVAKYMVGLKRQFDGMSLAYVNLNLSGANLSKTAHCKFE